MKPIQSLSYKHSPNLQATHKSVELSQTDLANRVDISQRCISAMGLDPASMRLDQLQSICGTLQLEFVLQTKGVTMRSQAGSTAHPTGFCLRCHEHPRQVADIGLAMA